MRFEYLYFDLGDATITAPQVTGGIVQPFGLISKYEFDGNIVRGAVNYGF